MNGQVEQMMRIVCCARKALYTSKNIDINTVAHERSIQFAFTDIVVDSIQHWYAECIKRGLRDMKYLVSVAVTQKHLAAFANASHGAIICVWDDGKISAFTPVWIFDKPLHCWDVVYHEQYDIALPHNVLQCSDQTEEFRRVLQDIQTLANVLGFPQFVDIFQKAYDSLYSGAPDNIRMPKYITPEFRGIYYAVMKADVFSGMCSWNDVPPVIAADMNLEREYDELSNKLFQQLRYHLMYITNNCWQKR